MSPEIQVRPATPDDLPQLMAFDHSSATEYVWQLELRRESRSPQFTAMFREVRLPRAVNLEYPHKPSALAEEWEQKAMVLLAASGVQPVGYAALTQPRAPSAWVSDLVVVPRWRRRGVATALLGGAQEWAKERGCRRLFLEMQTKNHPAIHMAQKLGYEFCGYNDHYYSTQDIALFFVRAL